MGRIVIMSPLSLNQDAYFAYIFIKYDVFDWYEYMAVEYIYREITDL